MGENRLLTKTSGPGGETKRGLEKKLHNKDLCYLCSLLNITEVIKSRRWASHVARIGGREIESF